MSLLHGFPQPPPRVLLSLVSPVTSLALDVDGGSMGEVVGEHPSLMLVNSPLLLPCPSVRDVVFNC